MLSRSLWTSRFTYHSVPMTLVLIFLNFNVNSQDRSFGDSGAKTPGEHSSGRGQHLI